MVTNDYLCLKYCCCLFLVIVGCVCVFFGILPDEENPWKNAIKEQCKFDAEVIDYCSENQTLCINQTIQDKTFYYDVEGDTCNGTIIMHIPCASACGSNNDNQPSLPNDRQYYPCWIVECEAINGVELSSNGKAYYSFINPEDRDDYIHPANIETRIIYITIGISIVLFLGFCPCIFWLRNEYIAEGYVQEQGIETAI